MSKADKTRELMSEYLRTMIAKRYDDPFSGGVPTGLVLEIGEQKEVHGVYLKKEKEGDKLNVKRY